MTYRTSLKPPDNNAKLLIRNSGDFSMKLIWISKQKARVAHFCDLCGEWIEPGEVYRRHIWIPDPDSFLAIKEHIDCPLEEGVVVSVPDTTEVELTVVVAFKMEAVQVMLIGRNGEPLTETEFRIVSVLTTIPITDEDIPF